MLQNAGIELPEMYKLGYQHNNCIGCVKSSGAGYWNKIKIDFPERYFLSPAWREWIQRLADKSPVVLVTAPRHSRMRRLADSYLASYMSDEFTVISA